MKHFLISFLMAMVVGFSHAQTPSSHEVEDPQAALPVQQAELVLRDGSWFADALATAEVVFPDLIDAPETAPESSGGGEFSRPRRRHARRVPRGP